MPSRSPPWTSLALAVLSAAACSGAEDGAAKASGTRPNVLLVTLDTVRADRIGCYGYSRAKTPHLDALANRGVRFSRAYAHTPYTLPSHATILTGKYPDAHGVHVNFQGSIHPEALTLTEILRRDGYRTAAFVASSVLDRRFGLARGFDDYDDLSARPLSKSTQTERPGGEVTQAAVRWMGNPSDKPFFAWVHYYDAHDPYVPPEGFRDFEDPYDGEIAFVDHETGELVASLERSGVLANTLVVVTSDHGEAFGEHGEIGHGLFVYDATMHVPLILAGSTSLRPGTTFDAPVGLVDLLSTVLDLLGLPAQAGVDGRSLRPALEGVRGDDVPLEIESEYSWRSFSWAPLHGLVSGPWKYIHAPRDELFDLSADPGETKNLAEDRADVRESLAKTLARLRAASNPVRPGDVHLGEDTRMAISRLGYVEGAPVDEDSTWLGLKDPKDMVDVFVDFAHARSLARAERHAEALQIAVRLTARSPESSELWAFQGKTQLTLGRTKDAVASLERSLVGFPDSVERLRLLGDALLADKRTDEALARFRRALEIDPLDGQSHGRLGQFHARAGSFDQAIPYLQRFVDLEPTSPNAHTNLANGLFGGARFEEGIAHLKEALRLDPVCVPALESMITVRKALRQDDAMVEALRAAVAALPEAPSFRARLAWALATLPNSREPAHQEALALAQALARESPADPAVLDLLGVALARRGDFRGAAEAAQKAVSLAEERGQEPMVRAFRARLEMYRSDRPYLE